jgi:hypothetical protein
MALESTQLLCTAINELSNGKIATPYKSTHTAHPVTKWVMASSANWLWTYHHAFSLCKEYTIRYGKVHKCQGIIESLDVDAACNLYDHRKLTGFVNCARNKQLNIDYTDVSDVHMAYQYYLSDRWEADKISPTWYKRG